MICAKHKRGGDSSHFNVFFSDGFLFFFFPKSSGFCSRLCQLLWQPKAFPVSIQPADQMVLAWELGLRPHVTKLEAPPPHAHTHTTLV